MKKILYVLQQSIYNNNGKWLTADSNINMMLGMLRAFRKRKEFKNYQFDILIAPLEDFEDLESYDSLFKSENVKFIPFNFPVNAFHNRQNFVVNDWISLDLYQYDYIINNITELTRNLKTIIYKSPEILNESKMPPKIITQCFWLDAPEINESKIDKHISYDWRQFDGFECSDLVTFTCESTRDAFIENAAYKFNKKYIMNILNKSIIWDFGYSEDEKDEYRPEQTKKDKKRILFLNRLSGLNYTHHEEFIEAIKILSKKRDDFEVVFTNPSRKISFEWLKENVPNLLEYKNNKPLNREEYWELLHSADVSVHLFKLERYGGCALRESIASGNTPVAIDCFEQGSIINNRNLLLDNTDVINVNELANRINYALDVPDHELKSIIDENYKRCSFENTINQVIKDLEKLGNKYEILRGR
jgi:hypothetical protein